MSFRTVFAPNGQGFARQAKQKNLKLFYGNEREEQSLN